MQRYSFGREDESLTGRITSLARLSVRPVRASNSKTKKSVEEPK